MSLQSLTTDDMQISSIYLCLIVRERKLACYPLAKALVFNNVHAALGLDRCRIIISGGAPINRETLEFFMSLDLLLLNAYGMSESSGSCANPF